MKQASVGSGLVTRPLFPAGEGGSIPTPTLRARHLTFERITRRRLECLVREWHRTRPQLGAINTMRVCYGAWHSGTIYAVAAWSNPTARALPQESYLELRRLAVAPDAPRNTPSRMLAWMTREIVRSDSRIVRLVSYQDADEHDGTIYRAAGWRPVHCGRGGAWNNREDGRRTSVRVSNKIRWEYDLRPGEAK